MTDNDDTTITTTGSGAVCTGPDYFKKVKKIGIILVTLFIINLIIQQFLRHRNKLMISLLFILIFCLLAPLFDYIEKGLTDALCVGLMFAIGMSFIQISQYSSHEHVLDAASKGIANLQKRAV